MKQSTRESLERYRDYGVPTGDFLNAVLTNDLVEAFGRADEQNALDMHEIVKYIYNHMPSGCWRTKEKITAWIEHKGLSGKEDVLLPGCKDEL
jgi:hypothetical protein